jgi:tetratricopeptide (TPR) repeat protein
MASGNTADLEKVFDDYPQSKIAPAAAITSANIHLGRGTDLLLQNKALANQELGYAIDLYQKALEKNPDGILREQAYYGLGRAEESQGKLKDATQYYGKVIDENPEGVYARLARQRRDDLRRPSIKQFYDRLAEYEPKPAFQDLPNVPNPGSGLDVNDLPKESPVFPLQDPLKLGPSSGEQKPAAPGGEKQPKEAKTPSLPSPETPAPPTAGGKKPEPAKSPVPQGPEIPAPTATPDSGKKSAETTPPKK